MLCRVPASVPHTALPQHPPPTPTPTPLLSGSGHPSGSTHCRPVDTLLGRRACRATSAALPPQSLLLLPPVGSGASAPPPPPGSAAAAAATLAAAAALDAAALPELPLFLPLLPLLPGGS